MRVKRRKTSVSLNDNAAGQLMPDDPDGGAVFTVTQLTRQIKNLLETQIGSVWVSGEISNYRPSASGHAYFTLKDADSEITAVIFRGKLSRLKFEPENGLEVIVSGQLTVYEKRGNYQIVCDDMQPKGMGALQLAFERLKRKLDDESLFDPALKKPIPLLPRRIGIVTSPTGAAIRDMLHVIRRRFAGVHITIYPARVQGEDAAPELVEGIRTLDALGMDVLIIGRGGGSLEDLWPFNEEPVVRAVFAAKTPIISAVGHEIDFVLTDFAADLRAPTPSAAAELVVRERQSLLDNLTGLKHRLARTVQHQIQSSRHRLAMAQSSYCLRRPDELLRQQIQQVDELRIRLEDAIGDWVSSRKDRVEKALRSLTLLSPAMQTRRAQDRLATLQQRLQRVGADLPESGRIRLYRLMAQLDALSPLAILQRGYALAWKQPEKQLIHEARALTPGDTIRIQFAQGGVTATVNQIEESTNGE